MSWIISDAARLELAHLLDEWGRERDSARDLCEYAEVETIEKHIAQVEDWRRRNITV